MAPATAVARSWAMAGSLLCQSTAREWTIFLRGQTLQLGVLVVQDAILDEFVDVAYFGGFGAVDVRNIV